MPETHERRDPEHRAAPGPPNPPDSRPTDVLLEVSGLTVNYGRGISALRGVDLSVRAGEVVALLGPNGAGKSTTARVVTGMLGRHGGAISAGSVRMAGEPIEGWSANRIVRAGISQVLEGRQTVAELTVAENLRIGGYTRRRSRRATEEVLGHVLELFPVLRTRVHERAGYLSGGEQQMLVIGRALMQQPRLLLLDEPTLGLSPRMAAEIAALITRINAEGTSILLIEQNATSALELSSYAYVLESGEVTLEGSAAELRRNEHIRTAYLGTGAGEHSYAGVLGPLAPERPATREDLLRVDGLTLRIGGVTALSDVSFSVGRGELFAVIGPNGAGKTSLLNALSGFYRPQEGSVHIAGKPLLGLPPWSIARLGCARTFQNLALFDHLPVIDNVMVGRERFRRSGAAAGAVWRGPARREERRSRETCSEMIELAGLARWRDRPVGTLSYGLRKRVELARALVMEPRLLLLDEPVAGLNFEETAELVSYVLRARTQLDLTVILIEHDLRLVMDVAERILVLNFGHRIALDRPEVVRAIPEVVAAYLGEIADGVDRGIDAGIDGWPGDPIERPRASATSRSRT